MKEKTKIHSLLVEAIAQALSDIFASGRYADKVIEFYLKKNRKWGARDRKFFAESVYEVVRWWRFLWWLKGDAEVGSLDLTSLKSVWAHCWAWKKGEPIEPFLTMHEFQKLTARLSERPPPAFLFSIPDWLLELGKKELGEDRWFQALKFLNKPALIYLRANSLKGSAQDLILRLQAEGISATLPSGETRRRKNPSPLQISEEGSSNAIVLTERKNVFASPSFKGGFFEVQDWSSQQVAPMLDVAPGMRVIDACAGAGGKTLHIAALMKNKGKIIALDIHEWKLKELRTRASRAGVDVIEVKLLEGQKTIKRLEESADRVLLDVPCSGLGVLRRNPDSKWKLSLTELQRLSQLQQEILDSYSRMVKRGGKLVYSTCSLLPSENEGQVMRFLEGNKDFSLVKQKILMPQDYDSDGFYMAQLERKN